jgi:hypothetical protein
LRWRRQWRPRCADRNFYVIHNSYDDGTHGRHFAAQYLARPVALVYYQHAIPHPGLSHVYADVIVARRLSIQAELIHKQ